MTARRSIRVLMTTDTVGGVWTYSTALASALKKMGAEVHLLTLGPRPREHQRAEARGQTYCLRETDLALEWQDPAGSDMANARQVLTKLEQEIGPDIVHLNSYREAAFDWKAPVLVAAHSCVNSWAMATSDRDWLADPKWRHYTQAVAHGLSRADAWVAPTRAFHRTVSELYRPPSQGAVIWNGIVPAGETAGRKQEFILAAGRMWDAAKNMAALTKAAAGLPSPVRVAGQAAEPDNAGNIELLGQLSHNQLSQIMRDAAIFTSPAVYEPFGLSVLEAASAGCALVLSDIPSFRELWDGAALFVDPNNPAELHAALARLCAQERLRTQLQRAAQAHAGRYALAATAQQYRSLYGTMLTAATRSFSDGTIEVPA